MTFRKHSAWALIAGVLGMGATWSVAAPVLQSEAIVVSGSFHVDDLLPDDGQDPYALVQPPWPAGTVQQSHFSSGRWRSDLGLSENVQSIDGGLFSDAPAAHVSAPGAVGTVSGSSQFLTVSADLSEVQDFLGAAKLGEQSLQSMETSAALSSLNGVRFVIGAHSSITITGFMTPIAIIDHQALLGTPELQAVLQQGQTLSLKSTASIQLNLFDPLGPCCGSNLFAYADLSVQTLIDPVAGVSESSFGMGASPLQLTFVNNSDQEVVRVLDVRTHASVSAAILPVPEPDTWILTGLGLLGMGVALRQQRRSGLLQSS